MVNFYSISLRIQVFWLVMLNVLYVAASLILKVSVLAEDARFAVSCKYISLMVIVFL